MEYNEEDADTGATEDVRVGDNDEDLLRRLKTWEKRARLHWSKWRQEARMCYNFVAGEQWSSDDKVALLDQMRVPIVFNRTGPMVDAVTGAEVLNRQEVRYSPVEMGDVKTNEIISAANDWVRDQTDSEDEESDAFSDTVVCGMGWTETRMDYEEDPEGLIRIERVDPLEMWCDPATKKRNLTDAKYVFRGRYRDRTDLPKNWREKIGSRGTEGGDMNAMGQTGPGDDYEEGEDETDTDGTGDKHKVWIQHFQWWDLEDAYRIQDPTSQQMATLDKQQYKDLTAQYLALGMRPPPAAKIQVRKYREAFVGGGRLLETKEVACNRFTFNCITGKRDRNKNIWYGIVRAMMDPQMWANKWLSQILHVLNTSASGGLMVEEGAVNNYRELLDSWAKPNSIVEFKQGALIGGKVQERTASNYPQGLDRLLEFAIGSMPQVTGINMEMLGLVERDQPGVLEAQRKKAGYAILAVFFDSLRRYRKRQGRVQLDYITKYLSDGRLIRIVGDDGIQQYVPLLRDPEFKKYDVIVDEAPMSANQKEMVWQMMVQMMPILRDTGAPTEIWSELLRYSPLPSAVSEKITQILQEQGKPDPEQQQLQQQMVIGEVKKIHSEAAKNETQAMLNAAKAQSEGAAQQLPDGQFELNQAKGQAELMRAQGQVQTEQEKAGVERAKAMREMMEGATQAQQNRAEQLATLMRARSQVQVDEARAEAVKRPPSPPGSASQSRSRADTR